MKKSVEIYNKYLNTSNAKLRKSLYKDLQIEVIKERINFRMKKFSFGIEFFELLSIPIVIIYSIIVD